MASSEHAIGWRQLVASFVYCKVKSSREQRPCTRNHPAPLLPHSVSQQGCIFTIMFQFLSSFLTCHAGLISGRRTAVTVLGDMLDPDVIGYQDEVGGPFFYLHWVCGTRGDSKRFGLFNNPCCSGLPPYSASAGCLHF